MERIVWFYWSQGWAEAPWFVKRNYLSWVVRNPEWKVVFLDDSNIEKYSDALNIVKRNRYRISVTGFSDILRLDLLTHRGGAWVDATLICMNPLETWLPQATEPSGFFSFRSGCLDRDLATWHVAARSHNYLVTKWLELAKWYWGEHDFDNPEPWLPIIAELEKKYCGSHEATAGFFSSEVLNLRVYPYFWVNYLHQMLVRDDAVAGEIWSKTTNLFCGAQSTFLQHDPLLPPNDYTGMIINKPDIMMLKFDRRRMPEAPPAGSVLDLVYGPWLKLDLPELAEVMAPTEG